MWKVLRRFDQFSTPAGAKLFPVARSDSRWQVLRERLDDRLMFGLVGEIHGFGRIVLLVVELGGDDLRAVAFAPKRAAPASVADAV